MEFFWKEFARRLWGKETEHKDRVRRSCSPVARLAEASHILSSVPRTLLLER